MTDRIAIVSLSVRFPGSGADLDRFWENVASAADRSLEVPTDRCLLPPTRCTDPRLANPDTVASTRGYYLDPFSPDLTGLALEAALVSQLDPLFHLVLDVGNRAWRGARTEKIDRTRVGVVLGNICLPTDRSSDLCREVLGGRLDLSEGHPPPGPLRGPTSPTRGEAREEMTSPLVGEVAVRRSRTAGVRDAFNTHPLNRYVAGLPAGLLAKGLGLGGGSFTLDAACASSLYALKLAADELLAGRADAMLAGGVNGADCQYTQFGFSQLRALSPSGRCAPFDAT